MGSPSPITTTLPSNNKTSTLAALLRPIADDLGRVETLLGEQVAGFDPGVHEYVGYVRSGWRWQAAAPEPGPAGWRCHGWD